MFGLIFLGYLAIGVIGALGMGLLWYNATQAYYWKRKYLALRNAPMLREIESELRQHFLGKGPN